MNLEEQFEIETGIKANCEDQGFPYCYSGNYKDWLEERIEKLNSALDYAKNKLENISSCDYAFPEFLAREALTEIESTFKALNPNE